MHIFLYILAYLTTGSIISGLASGFTNYDDTGDIVMFGLVWPIVLFLMLALVISDKTREIRLKIEERKKIPDVTKYLSK